MKLVQYNDYLVNIVDIDGLVSVGKNIYGALARKQMSFICSIQYSKLASVSFSHWCNYGADYTHVFPVGYGLMAPG